MPINENEFFREATLRICSTLDVEQALLACLNYVKDFIPSDRLGFTIYDPTLGAFRTLAIVSPTGVLEPRIWPILPPRYREMVEKMMDDFTMAISYRMADNEVSSFMAEPYGIGDFATLAMALPLEKQGWGQVVLHHTTSKGVYTEEHAHLLNILKQPFCMAFSNCLQYKRLKEAKELLAEDYQRCRAALDRPCQGHIIGEGNGLKRVMESVRLVAPLESPVLLMGETGTGKEVIAEAIHNLSHRKGGPFVKVNCGAIPETLIDSHLFGHVKGAFTGAQSQRAGCFERSDGGTIFLDEVGELPLEAQVRLLRVLQEKVIERVGGTEPIKVDIRIIAATHRNLESMMADSLFRKDLFFRLSVFPIMIPPLRERLNDIPILVHHFIQKKSAEIRLNAAPALAYDAVDRLMSYDWPGNVRELENTVERELIRCGGNPLTFQDLASTAKIEPAGTSVGQEEASLRLDDVLRHHLERVLKMTEGRVHGESGAAKLLDINPATLRKRMDKLGLAYGRRYRPQT